MMCTAPLCSFLSAPAITPLFTCFHGAIVESGGYMIFNIESLAAQEALGTTFATAVGCTGTLAAIAACLRAAPVASLILNQGIINTRRPRAWRACR